LSVLSCYENLIELLSEKLVRKIQIEKNGRKISLQKYRTEGVGVRLRRQVGGGCGAYVQCR
jgi:hypothetical protein